VNTAFGLKKNDTLYIISFWCFVFDTVNILPSSKTSEIGSPGTCYRDTGPDVGQFETEFEIQRRLVQQLRGQGARPHKKEWLLCLRAKAAPVLDCLLKSVNGYFRQTFRGRWQTIFSANQFVQPALWHLSRSFLDQAIGFIQCYQLYFISFHYTRGEHCQAIQ